MEVAGIVALVYVGGMVVTTASCCCLIGYANKDHSGMLADAMNCGASLAIGVFWPITVPYILISECYNWCFKRK